MSMLNIYLLFLPFAKQVRIFNMYDRFKQQIQKTDNFLRTIWNSYSIFYKLSILKLQNFPIKKYFF